MAKDIPIEDLYAQPIVQQLLSRLEEDKKAKADLSNLPDLEEIKLPFVMNDKVLMSPGVWNNYFYSADAIKDAFLKSKWDEKEVRSLFLDHVDKSAREWVGEVRNARLDGDTVKADLVFVDKPTAQKLAYGAKFGISPKVHGMEDNQRMINFLFDNFSVVINPAVKNAYINNSQQMAVPETDITGKFNMGNDRSPENIIRQHDPKKKCEATYSAAGSRGEMASYPGSPTPPLPPDLKAGEQPKNPKQVTQDYAETENKQFYPIDVSGKGYMSPSEAERKVNALPGTMASYPDNMEKIPPNMPNNPPQISETYVAPKPPAAGDLSPHAKSILKNAFESAIKQGYSKERAAKIAWAAVKNAGFSAGTKMDEMKISDKPTEIKQGVSVSMHEHVSREEAKKVFEALKIPQEIPFGEFYVGLNIEFEHGKEHPQTDITHDDLIKTGKIAWAHLIELKDYYTRLLKMEKKGKEQTKEVSNMSDETFEIVFNTLADMDEGSVSDIVKKAKASRKDGELWADAVMRSMSVYKEPTGGDAKPKKQDGPFKAFGNPPTDAQPLKVKNSEMDKNLPEATKGYGPAPVPAIGKDGKVPQKMEEGAEDEEAAKKCGEYAIGNPGEPGDNGPPATGDIPLFPSKDGKIPQAMKESDIMDQMVKLADMLKMARAGAMAEGADAKKKEQYPKPEEEKETKAEEDKEKKEMKQVMQKMSQQMKEMEIRLNEPAPRHTLKTEELAAADVSKRIASDPDAALLSILSRMS